MQKQSIKNISPQDYIDVRCPKCKQRLFDISPPAMGFVEIKCPRCKYIHYFDLSLYTASFDVDIK